jgi:hypothetical protein
LRQLWAEIPVSAVGSVLEQDELDMVAQSGRLEAEVYGSLQEPAATE